METSPGGPDTARAVADTTAPDSAVAADTLRPEGAAPADTAPGGAEAVPAAEPDTAPVAAPDTVPPTVGDTVAAAGRRLTPDTVPPSRPGGCTLTWRPLSDSTRSVSREVARDVYTTFVSGPMLWTCGDARITADSAVRYAPEQRVEMIGDVDYRDSVRTLTSRRLTYFQRTDLVIAERNVRLTRRASGSTLEGPRVEFYRAGARQVQRTVATGRPHMVVRPRRDTAAAAETRPFQVDSDSAVFHGEARTEAFGRVVVYRDDLRATGRYAAFHTGEGSGVLTGEPVLEGTEFTMTGDSIGIQMVGDELRQVEAWGRATLTGERGMEVRAPRIRVALRGEEPRELWAHGEASARALSAQREIWGDSLRFVFTAGRMDSLFAVGSASAVELDTVPPLPEAGGTSSPAGPGGSPAEATPGDTAGTTADSAAGATVPGQREPAGADSVAAGAAAPDSAVSGWVAPDSVPTETAAGDTAAAGAAGPAGPRLGTARNWIAGDTLVAAFSPADTAAADTAAAAGPPEESDRVRLRHLRATGNARSFYSVLRDTAQGTYVRNYMLGHRIDIRFAEGEARRVEGKQAIGVFLEPMPPGAAVPAAAADTLPAGAPTDTVPSAAGADAVPPASRNAAGAPGAPGAARAGRAPRGALSPRSGMP